MDIYLPASESSVVSKVVVLVHGGAWFSGEKADMLEFIPFLKRDFPDYCIANMNYRLGLWGINLRGGTLLEIQY